MHKLNQAGCRLIWPTAGQAPPSAMQAPNSAMLEAKLDAPDKRRSDNPAISPALGLPAQKPFERCTEFTPSANHWGCTPT